MKTRFRAVPALAGAILLAAAAAHADLTVQSQTSMSTPMMKNQPGMAGGLNIPMTAYYSGKKARVEEMFITMIVDAGAGKMTMLNSTAHTYQTLPFDPKTMAAGGLPAGPAAAAAKSMKVTDTGHTMMILGHLCREYVVFISIPSPAGGGTITSRMDAWVAPDLIANPALQGLGGLPSGIASAAQKMRGMPLRMTMTYDNGPAFMQGMKMTMMVTSVTTGPIPASKFVIPPDYKQGQAFQGAPGMGGMMPGAR
jgi:hypothetical protein